MANGPVAAGKRLGDLLVRRRIELNPAWRSRKAFADEHMLQVRIVSDLENGNRFNFEPATIAAAEVAYKLAAGSLRRGLETGELEPAPEPRPANGQFQVIPGGTGEFTDSPEGVRKRSRDAILAAAGPYILELRARVEAARIRNPQATGWDIFPEDPVLARLWEIDIESEFDRMIPMAAYLANTRQGTGIPRRTG